MSARNELEVRWVADVDWRLTRDFDHAGDRAAAAWYLDIDGIDTVAEVTLNGTLVLDGAERLPPLPARRDRGAAAGQQHASRSCIRSATRAATELQSRQPFPIPYAAQNSPDPQRQHAAQAGLPFRLGLEPGDRAARRLRHDRAASRCGRPASSMCRSRSGITTTARSTSTSTVTLFGREAGAVPLTIRFAGEESDDRGRGRRAGETRSHRTLHHRRSRNCGGRPASGEQTLYPLEVVMRRRRRAPPDRPAQDRAADRRGRGRRALRLPRQRPRDLLPGRQLDPGRRAAVDRRRRS